MVDDYGPPDTSMEEPLGDSYLESMQDEAETAAEASRSAEAEADFDPTEAIYSSDLADLSDVDCSDIGHQVEIDDSDPHYLDADGDGWGCEPELTADQFAQLEAVWSSLTPAQHADDCRTFRLNRAGVLADMAEQFGDDAPEVAKWMTYKCL